MAARTLPQEFFELLNRYPSPHNGQPICLHKISDTEYELQFESRRGLQAAEVSYLFSFVTMGLFVTYLHMCAEAYGLTADATIDLPKRAALKTDATLAFGRVTLQSSSTAPNLALRKALEFRQTSRRKYSAGIDDDVSNRTVALAKAHNMQLVKMDRHGTHQAIWLNQRAVFDDMFDDAVRHELDHWLRYDHHEKVTKMDGLAYDCMELNGRAMKFIMRHYKLLRAPGVSWLLKKYYLRTMSDNSDAYYMLTPFSNEQESFDVGVAIMQVWAEIAKAGCYLHPFGTIMSNEAAHQDFLKLIGVTHEDVHTNFLVFIYRAGISEPPHQSARIPLEQHLIRSTHV